MPLNLPDTKVGAAISMATKSHLEQVHYLLGATHLNRGHPGHFGVSAVAMTVLTIAAASAIRYFNPQTNKKDKGDREAFIETVKQFFPWGQVTVEDDQHRAIDQRREAASKSLYEVIRNPLVHSGGVTGKRHSRLTIVHIFPGLIPEANDRAITDYCARTLDGETVIKLDAAVSTVYTRPLYWCTRRMIEALASDPDAQRDIEQKL